MTLEQYKQRAAEFRQHMEDPMAFTNPNCVMATKVSVYLPGGEQKSTRPAPPPYDSEDLSHMNSISWQRHQAAGKKNPRGKK